MTIFVNFIKKNKFSSIFNLKKKLQKFYEKKRSKQLKDSNRFEPFNFYNETFLSILICN